MKTIILPVVLMAVIAISGSAAILRHKNNETMKPKIHIVTLGASDFPKMLSFYKNSLGWSTKAKATDKIAFFDLSGLVFALCDMKVLKEDSKQPINSVAPSHITLAQNVSSENEVDKAFVFIEKAGGKIVKVPQKTNWGGYSGYFADPEGNLWEIAYNPYFKFDKDGNIVLP